MPISAITQRQHGFQQRIGRSLFVSISLAMLLSVGFSGWSILRDYQSSIEQHQRSMTSLSRALEGYSSTLLKQSYESVRVSGKELARQQLGKGDSQAVLAVLRTAMRYDSVSRYLFARIEGQLFIIDVTGQPVHDQALHEPLQRLQQSTQPGLIQQPLQVPGQAGFLLPLLLDIKRGTDAPLQLGALIPTDRFGDLIERLGLEPTMNAGLLSEQGVVLYRTPHPEEYIGRSLPPDSPLLMLDKQQITSFVDTRSVSGDPSFFALTPSPRFPLAAVIGETRASVHQPWLRRSALTLALLVVSLLLLAGAAFQLRRMIRQLSQDEEFYRRLFTNVNDGLLLIDRDGPILTANPAAAAQFGLHDATALCGRLPSSLSPEQQPDGSLSTVSAGRLHSAVLDGHAQQQGWRFLRQDNGQPFDCEVRVSRFRWRDRDLLFGVLHDITERKRYLATQEFLANQGFGEQRNRKCT
ncbi:TPA: PAS domain S-box protein [Pseudomonas aeruginosa]|nr:PAS domain S-box protein [Pseudomonas aeruginosa]HEJ3546777.1 PAS domain S-box protein [Pseudomonas aeruginosa]HEN8210738.1 PAS domain S-box protein [Pseudomonas aeruginosa]